ncbi:uroporphyrinogen-III synthase [Paraferrimonas sp. SM1919]|uniref:uroporphyrinogen-III synthase n=1 Tax=Paraferrimonas sp. SM1919 TaxID=2662263 RepID=UPI0013D7584E|nr:uroporphyrinogen-III synthase [Paraferrimonas sp. SM1919]
MNVLLTRPQGRNENLSALLNGAGIGNIISPILKIVPHNETHPDITQYNKVIFISKNAVDFVDRKALNLANVDYFAVGKSTAEALVSLGQKVTTPAIQSTEGLLALTELSSVENQKILIIRGVGGREDLKHQLQIGGANVDYWQVYRRIVNPSLKPSSISQWHHIKIDHILITSGESLLNLINLVADQDKDWLFNCTLVVISERIALLARKHGFSKLILCNSANDKDILAKLAKGVL